MTPTAKDASGSEQSVKNEKAPQISISPPKLPGWVKMKEDVVISGISGLFPDCHNIDEYKEKLLNKVDMVTEGGGRWPEGESKKLILY
mgnify:CR=1 FL=1